MNPVGRALDQDVVETEPGQDFPGFPVRITLPEIPVKGRVEVLDDPDPPFGRWVGGDPEDLRGAEVLIAGTEGAVLGIQASVPRWRLGLEVGGTFRSCRRVDHPPPGDYVLSQFRKPGLGPRGHGFRLPGSGKRWPVQLICRG